MAPLLPGGGLARLLVAVAAAFALVPAAATAAGDVPGSGSCPRTGVTIKGTAGPDRIVGTPGRDVICGLGGDDRIDGQSGDDRIYGGTGNDHIAGGGGKDLIFGNGGDDQIRGDAFGSQRPEKQPSDAAADVVKAGAGEDGLSGGPGDDYLDTGSGNSRGGGTDVAWGDAGDDVLIGTGVVGTDLFDGGDGNDILIPFPLRTSPAGNSARGGAGDDVIVLANALRDSASLGGAPQIPVPNSTCTVVLPFTGDPGTSGQLQCGLPWKLKGLGGDNLATVDIGTTTDGKSTYGGSLFDGLLRTDDVELRRLADGKARAQSDVCLCDPLVPGLWSQGDLVF